MPIKPPVRQARRLHHVSDADSQNSSFTEHRGSDRDDLFVMALHRLF
jgi:hypothetical protein